MEVIGYIASLLIGLSLGLVGAGGGILTVPVMVYLFHISPFMASSYSLFIIGFTSILAAVHKYRQGEVRVQLAILFCLISISVVSVIRKLVIPAIPQELFVLNGVPVESAVVNMLLFSLLMISTSYSMIRKRTVSRHHSVPVNAYARLLWCSVIVGVVTGLLGAGGGFLLIPALVFLMDLDMKEAIGTSLLIIAMNSLIGFTMDIDHFSIDWRFLGGVTIIATIGSFAGLAMGRRIAENNLKGLFGWFVMILGIAILVNECWRFFSGINENRLTGIIH